MKKFAALLFLISINGFAQVVPNVTGIELRLEKAVCKGAYQISEQNLVTAAAESEAVCTKLPTEIQLRECEIKLMKKYGVSRPMMTMDIVAEPTSQYVFRISMIENHRPKFDRYAYAEKANTARGGSAITFMPVNEEEVPFILDTIGLNAANTFSLGLALNFERGNGSVDTYFFVDGCTFNY